MNSLDKEVFYVDRHETENPLDPAQRYFHTGLNELLTVNLYPIEQFFTLLDNSETKDADDLKRAINVLRSLVEKASDELWRFYSDVEKHLGDIGVWREPGNHRLDREGTNSICAYTYQNWLEEEEDQGAEV